MMSETFHGRDEAAEAIDAESLPFKPNDHLTLRKVEPSSLEELGEKVRSGFLRFRIKQGTPILLDSSLDGSSRRTSNTSAVTACRKREEAYFIETESGSVYRVSILEDAFPTLVDQEVPTQDQMRNLMG